MIEKFIVSGGNWKIEVNVDTEIFFGEAAPFSEAATKAVEYFYKENVEIPDDARVSLTDDLGKYLIQDGTVEEYKDSDLQPPDLGLFLGVRKQNDPVNKTKFLLTETICKNAGMLDLAKIFEGIRLEHESLKKSKKKSKKA